MSDVTRGTERPHDLYRLYDGQGSLLYIGISYSALGRIPQHRAAQPWWTEVRSIDVQPLGDVSREEAERLERQAILTEKPIHNVTHNRSATPPPPAKPKRKHKPRSPKSAARAANARWVCERCHEPIPVGVEKGYIQVPQFSDLWECVCKRCDGGSTTRYWIDAGRITTEQDVAHWSEHLVAKAWFYSSYWTEMIDQWCAIPGAADAARTGMARQRERLRATSSGVKVIRL